jgi:putative ABC transport system ATP-binding protein
VNVETPYGERSVSQKDVIISVSNLTKKYKLSNRFVTALEDISLNIYSREVVAITGASGSGKSTLLQIIGCLDRPTSGKIIVNGEDITILSDARLSELRKNTIGFIFQSFYLQPFLRVKDNVAVPAMFTKETKRTIDQKVEKLLEQVGMVDQANRFPKELSGGQIQRTSIARALINAPSIILADEPTGNLDSTNSRSIIALFKKIRDETGSTVVIVTHDSEIAAGADRVIELKDGAII